MLKDTVEIEIIQPGRPVGQYTTRDSHSLRLDSVLYPETPLPFDMAAIPNMLTPGGEQLLVILLGHMSHPPLTQVRARLLGAVRNDKAESYLLAVPVADQGYSDWMTLDDLPGSLCAEVSRFLASDGVEASWLTLEAIEPFLRASQLNYLQAKAASSKSESYHPAWRPLDRGGRVIGYTEAEHYTDAEYTYFQLPNRFQFYMDSHLADDERILNAMHRPSMRSWRQRTRRGGKMLQEGVLILTDQRLIHLVELIPPGASGIRYGFEADMGVLERLVDVALEQLAGEVLLLRTQWEAYEGLQRVEWEFSMRNRSDLQEFEAILNKFLPGKDNPSALRRATFNPSPETLPKLRDPATNDPKEQDPLNERYSTYLHEILAPNERGCAWALWPTWFESRSWTEVLLVTNRRIVVIPDPASRQGLKLEIPLTRIASLKYVASILSSHIDLDFTEAGAFRQISLGFPYTAENAFHTCLEAIRRCMAILPLTRG